MASRCLFSHRADAGHRLYLVSEQERPSTWGDVATIQILHPLRVVPAKEGILERYLVGYHLRLACVLDYVGLASIEGGLVLGQRREHVDGDVRRRLVYCG